MDFDQSISDFIVKSCSGPFDQTSLVWLCCVTFKVPTIALANFVFKYFNKLFASTILSNFPNDINVCEYPVPGFRISGFPITMVFSASPIAGDPFEAGTTTLNLSKLG